MTPEELDFKSGLNDGKIIGDKIKEVCDLVHYDDPKNSVLLQHKILEVILKEAKYNV